MEQHWLLAAIEQFGYIAVLLAVGLESTGIPFPGETALVLAAVYAGTGGQLSIAGVIAAAATGAILGDNLGYTIGRRGGHQLLRRFGRVLHINERHIAYAEAYFERHGDKTVFFGRFFAVLRAWAAFLAGVNRMPRRTFMIWNALGGIVWAICYGTLGYVLGDNLPLLGRVLRVLGVGGTVAFVALVLVVAACWFLWRVGLLRSAWADATRARIASWLVRPGFAPPDPPVDAHSRADATFDTNTERSQENQMTGEYANAEDGINGTTTGAEHERMPGPESRQS